MPRIDDRLLDCSIYLYPTEADAKAGKRSGGSGFLVAVPARGKGWLIDGHCPRTDYHHVYAVTNRHVVEGYGSRPGSPVVRLNRHDGETKELPFRVDEWFVSKKDDLAVVPIEHSSAYKYLTINVGDFLSEDKAKQKDVGIGDEICMVGRFMGHDGTQRNSPSVRWGHVSLMPFEDVYHPSNPSHTQASFVVEIHSIGGYSGSPVFVRPIPTQKREVATNTLNCVVTGFSELDSEHPLISTEGGPWLLGVDWGYINTHDQCANNTGMSAVVPAWSLLDFLNTGKPLMQRKKEQADLKKLHDESGITLTSIQQDDGPITRPEFEAALKKVSRRLPPSESSESDSEKP